jgi:hypothetical protein
MEHVQQGLKSMSTCSAMGSYVCTLLTKGEASPCCGHIRAHLQRTREDDFQKLLSVRLGLRHTSPDERRHEAHQHTLCGVHV